MRLALAGFVDVRAHGRKLVRLLCQKLVLTRGHGLVKPFDGVSKRGFEALVERIEGHPLLGHNGLLNERVEAGAYLRSFAGWASLLGQVGAQSAADPFFCRGSGENGELHFRFSSRAHTTMPSMNPMWFPTMAPTHQGHVRRKKKRMVTLPRWRLCARGMPP